MQPDDCASPWHLNPKLVDALREDIDISSQHGSKSAQNWKASQLVCGSAFHFQNLVDHTYIDRRSHTFHQTSPKSEWGFCGISKPRWLRGSPPQSIGLFSIGAHKCVSPNAESSGQWSCEDAPSHLQDIDCWAKTRACSQTQWAHKQGRARPALEKEAPHRQVIEGHSHPAGPMVESSSNWTPLRQSSSLQSGLQKAQTKQ